ncbi:MAG TPA: fatty acid--CoA ligase family protein, partial [Pseudomonadales bacterium]|nr:fatty acid--CoA ligase family protein [Pseudomonadales bacterium]
MGILLRNNPACVSAVMQILASRRCVVSLNPFQSPDKIARDIESVGISALIALESDWQANSLMAEVIKARGCLGISMDAQALTAQLHDEVPFVVPETLDMHGTAILMLTSGTTGPAKRIPLRFDKLEKSLLSAASYEDKQNTAGQLTLKTTPAMLTTPLVHIGGMYFALAAVVSGRPLLIVEKFSVDECVEGIAENKIATVALPPTALRMLLDANVDKEKLRSLRAIRAGSAPLPIELQEKFEQTYGIPVLDSYGATEFAGAVAGWSLKDHKQFSQTKRGSVGRAQPGNELRVVDPATGAELPNGKIGLLEVRSAQIDSENWVRTNDLAELDDDGFLYIRGRADSAIIRGGFKVLPVEV